MFSGSICDSYCTLELRPVLSALPPASVSLPPRPPSRDLRGTFRTGSSKQVPPTLARKVAEQVARLTELLYIGIPSLFLSL